MTVTEDFIKQAEVEVSNQGYLKLTKINTCGKKSGNIIQKEAEVLVLVPEKEENLKKALKDIQGIKKGEISTTESKKFVKSINQSNNEVAVMSQGSGTKSNEIWGCAVNVVNLSFIVRNRYYLFSYFCVIFYLLFLVVKCSFYNYYCIYADLYLSYVHTYGCVVFVNVSFYNILLNSLVLLPTLPV